MTDMRRLWDAATGDPTFAAWLGVFLGCLGAVLSVVMSEQGITGVTVLFVVAMMCTTLIAIFETWRSYVQTTAGEQA